MIQLCSLSEPELRRSPPHMRVVCARSRSHKKIEHMLHLMNTLISLIHQYRSTSFLLLVPHVFMGMAVGEVVRSFPPRQEIFSVFPTGCWSSWSRWAQECRLRDYARVLSSWMHKEPSSWITQECIPITQECRLRRCTRARIQNKKTAMGESTPS
jgi:hypothetical protein